MYFVATGRQPFGNHAHDYELALDICKGVRPEIKNEEIEIQFKEAEEYRKANLVSIENYKIVTHPQAIYTSRLLNPITKDLPKNDDDYDSQCLDQVI
ncbi:unnamed protein product [Rhizophagus irregularis]|nr:unnamed protein product [Rhizophagus irregularis]